MLPGAYFFQELPSYFCLGVHTAKLEKDLPNLMQEMRNMKDTVRITLQPRDGRGDQSVVVHPFAALSPTQSTAQLKSCLSQEMKHNKIAEEIVRKSYGALKSLLPLAKLRMNVHI